MTCDWCQKEGEAKFGERDGYYQAWDWYVCRACWEDLLKDSAPI